MGHKDNPHVEDTRAHCIEAHDVSVKLYDTRRVAIIGEEHRVSIHGPVYHTDR